MSTHIAGHDAVRVLAFTCSRHRPVLLRHCILQMRSQTHPVDHSVYINGDQDTTALYEDLLGPHLILRYGPTDTYHCNYINAIRAARLDDYDLFCKIDDDDVYRTNYIETVVADFRRHGWDYSGSHTEGTIQGKRWNPSQRAQSLGNGLVDQEWGAIEIMPPTAAFSRRGIDCILNMDLDNLPAGISWQTHTYEDIGWRRVLARSGIRQHVREESRFVYHAHGSNVSTSHWLGEGNAIEGNENELPPRSAASNG
jgi:hypothetical protein